jgi:hypothetical protein
MLSLRENLGEARDDVDALIGLLLIRGEWELALFEHAQVLVVQTTAHHDDD